MKRVLSFGEIEGDVQWMIEKPANIRRLYNGVMAAKPMSL